MLCNGWYGSTARDQCDLPSKIETALTNDGKPLEPIIGYAASQETHMYGHPSELNKGNACPHYVPAGLVLRLARKVFFGVPLRPTVKKVALTDRVE